MRNLFAKLFRRGAGSSAPRRANGSFDAYTESRESRVVAKYFNLLEKIETAKSDKDYPKAIRAARETYRILGDWVRETGNADDGQLAIGRIPAVDTAGPMMAVMGDRHSDLWVRASYLSGHQS